MADLSRSEPTPKGWLNQTVPGAGVTSALGDFCYETTTVILPRFPAVLGLEAALLGLIEGIADAVAAFARMISGFIADKLGHRKLLVLVGYALTPVGQVLIALAVGWPLLLLGRVVSWFGKGLRGPLRDAMVAQAVSPGTRGRAFGFHRATDTLGAVAGPLLGVALLGWAQTLPWEALPWAAPGWGAEDGPFRLVLLLSVIPGVLAVVAFLVLVRDPGAGPQPGTAVLLHAQGPAGAVQAVSWGGGLFGVGDFSHALLILAATVLLTPSLGVIVAAQVAGLLYVWRNVVQVALSRPVGVAADLLGHGRVLVAGYGLGTLTAALMALAFVTGADSVLVLVGVFLIAGLHMTVQEAQEPTVTAEIVPADRLGTGYGVPGTVNGMTKFVSSAGVGALWTAVSPVLAFGLAALFMGLGTLALIRARVG